jgi:hypothetical protein
MVLKPDPVQPDVRWLSLNYQPWWALTAVSITVIVDQTNDNE